MAEAGLEAIRLDQLREEIRQPVKQLAEKLLADLGDEVGALAVVGSALTGDFHPKYSDINTVLVVRRRSHRLLQLIAGYGKTMGRQKLRAPLLMTEEYIRQSLDVFGVEFLDFQLTHAMVYGADPFAGLSFSKEDVRLQCERELKTALIQLRQGYIRLLGRSKAVGELLTASVGQLVVLLRAMLWLNDADRPREGKATLQKAAGEFQFEAEGVLPLWQMKRERNQPRAEQIETLFESLYQVIDHLARRVDQHRTGS